MKDMLQVILLIFIVAFLWFNSTEFKMLADLFFVGVALIITNKFLK